MKYTAKSFTLPASSNWTTQQNWDRAFLSPEQFEAKYGLPTCDDKQDVDSEKTAGV